MLADFLHNNGVGYEWILDLASISHMLVEEEVVVSLLENFPFEAHEVVVAAEVVDFVEFVVAAEVVDFVKFVVAVEDSDFVEILEAD
ncbi:hypothetical protein V6N11_015880 [Hibiscus sabdariffa]|uniref:Uncharacterized protein n=1 Tax=Hibiscus sabdariffa TaxID=183260 RepID=A0ABR2TTG3_9ROSI